MKDIILYDCASIPKDWGEGMAESWAMLSSLHVTDDVEMEVHAFPVENTSLMRFSGRVCEMLSTGCVKFHGTPAKGDNTVTIGQVLHEILIRDEDPFMVTVVTSSDATISLVRYIVDQDNDRFKCPVDVAKVSLTDRYGTICSSKTTRIASLKES